MTETTNNSLLHRYLAAVSRHLPADRKEDILAELSANLQAGFDDREEELGRLLSVEEQAAVLKRHGHPMEVALRYQPQRSLIGPAVFPLYAYVLKRAAPMVVLVVMVVGLAMSMAADGTGALLAQLGRLPRVLFFFWAVTTLVFAALEYAMTHYGVKLPRMRDWHPAKLPAADRTEPLRGIAPKHPMADLVFEALFLAWLVAVPRFPVLLFFGPAAQWLDVTAAPVWQRMFVPVMALLVTRLVLKAMAFDSRYSARRTGLLYVAADACSAIALALMVLPGEPLFTLHGMLPLRAEQGMQTGILLSLRIALAVAVACAGWKLWQTLRLRGAAGAAPKAVML